MRAEVNLASAVFTFFDGAVINLVPPVSTWISLFHFVPCFGAGVKTSNVQLWTLTVFTSLFGFDELKG